MTTITSLNDLIQKLSNDGDYKFSHFSTMFSLWLSSLGGSTRISSIYNHYGNIHGSIETLYYGGYVTEYEKDTLLAELSNIKDGLIENFISCIMEDVEEGD